MSDRAKVPAEDEVSRSLDLVVPQDDATHCLCYGIDRIGAAPGGMSRDSTCYYFGSALDAQRFREMERLHAGNHYGYGYEITWSTIKEMS